MYFSRTKQHCEEYEARYNSTNRLSWVDEAVTQNATFNTVRLAPPERAHDELAEYRLLQDSLNRLVDVRRSGTQ